MIAQQPSGRWTSTDRGATWTNTRHVTANSKYSHNHVKVVFNQRRKDFRVIWSYGDSHYPPATRKVYLYYYGQADGTAKRVVFPSSCLGKPRTTPKSRPGP